MKRQPIGPFECYALTARRMARYLSRAYDTHLAPSGLSVSQFSILSLVADRGRIKIAELAKDLVMERTSLVRALKPLQSAGWVVADRLGSDRSLDLSLSPSGLAKVEEAQPLWRAAQAAFDAEVGRDRAESLRNQTLELDLTD